MIGLGSCSLAFDYVTRHKLPHSAPPPPPPFFLLLLLFVLFFVLFCCFLLRAVGKLVCNDGK